MTSLINILLFTLSTSSISICDDAKYTSELWRGVNYLLHTYCDDTEEHICRFNVPLQNDFSIRIKQAYLNTSKIIADAPRELARYRVLLARDMNKIVDQYTNEDVPEMEDTIDDLIFVLNSLVSEDFCGDS